MRRVIGFVVCGFTLAACSASIPSLDFFKSSPAKTALRFESAPPGAQVKVAGQTCRTPCELKLEVAELSVTFTRKGYQPQTVSVRSEGGGVFSAAEFAPNPVHADLVATGASARNSVKEKVARGGRQTKPTPTADSDTPEATAPSSNPNPNWAEVR